MPVYEYECEKHKIIEVQQTISDPILEECPLCRQETDTCSPVKKLISVCNFHLIGGGWAKTGYS